MPTKKKKAPEYGIPPDLVIGPEADQLPLSGEINWGMDVMGVDALRAVTQGEGVVTGIVDTGVDSDHPLLANCFAAKDFTRSGSGSRDRNGHGSHVTGTVAGTDPRIGVAYKARVVHGKGLSDSGSGSDRALVAAMDWCIEQGAELLSCSWGSDNARSPAIEAALERYARDGIWPIFAAGNAGPGTPDAGWPGRSEFAINVAALARDLTPATFTSAGAKLDTSGPGVDIWSARPGGGYRLMSGTSMATPWVAGVLHLFRAALKVKRLTIPTVAELREMLFRSSTDTHTPGDDRRTGPGWATPMLLAVGLTPDPLPPVTP